MPGVIQVSVEFKSGDSHNKWERPIQAIKHCFWSNSRDRKPRRAIKKLCRYPFYAVTNVSSTTLVLLGVGVRCRSEGAHRFVHESITRLLSSRLLSGSSLLSVLIAEDVTEDVEVGFLMLSEA
jgi:hypothetical protein